MTSRSTILFLDHNNAYETFFASVCHLDYSVWHFTDIDQLKASVGDLSPDVMFTFVDEDTSLGFDAIEFVRAKFPEVKIAAYSENKAFDLVVRALNDYAVDAYFTIPIDDVDALRSTVYRLTE